MTTDLDTRLTDLRAAPSWTVEDRVAILDRVLAAERTGRPTDVVLAASSVRRGRRTGVAAAVAGLAAAACIAVPTLLPGHSPGSATDAGAVQALHRLAHVAAVSPADRVGPTQFLHLVDVGRQSALSGQPSSVSRIEFWIRPDGLTYQRRDIQFSSGPSDREVWVNGPGPFVIDGMTSAQYLDRLPTHPAALESYVRAHTSGSTSADERVFVAITDIVRRGVAGPALRSAAIEVLARLGHVRFGDETRDVRGDPVQAFDFVDPHGRPDAITTIMFDRRTAQITEERSYFHGRLFTSSTVPVFEVVDAVPATVLASAVPQK